MRERGGHSTVGGFKLKSRQWVVDDKDRIIIGEGRSKILENIEKTGSINKTAKMMKMSYKGVWSKIKTTERYMKMKLVETDKKRGSRLTPEGKELLEKYNDLKRRCLKEDDKIFRSIFDQNKTWKKP
ncbi:MAG: LysR family transcriptional regulator [Deltaproteobacteria bacterium]|nr:LysR family transcriptional regulator [Deltaproteobacteria bacterium]